MKSLFAALLAVSVSAPAFAVECSRTGTLETDNMSVLVNTNGTFEIGQYEAHYYPSAEQVSVVEGNNYETGKVDSIVAMVQNQTVNVSVEGDEQTAPMTAVFVYNPAQKAGRLTAIVDGQTIARNLLFENCK